MKFTKAITRILKAGLFGLSIVLTTFGAAGDVDLSFDVHPSKEIVYTGSTFNGSMLVQPDGKILIYGGFSVVNNKAANRLIRLNTDGSLDTSFNCSECNKLSMSNALLQADGKIIVAGSILAGSFSRSKAIRINPDGSLDSSFAIQFSETLEATNYGAVLYSLQPDGKIYIGQLSQSGGFTGVTTYRLNSNGSFDTGFASFFTNTRLGRGFVSGITPLSDGRLYVYGATSFGAITRLNANGSEDSTFEKPVLTYDGFQTPPSVSSIVVQTDGKIVIGGNFITINGISKRNFARLNPGGNLDLNFTELPDSLGGRIRQYPDGKLLVSRRYDIPAGLFLPVKLTSDGAIDSPPLAFPANLVTVFSFEITVGNKIYIYGVFEENGRQLIKLARLNADGGLDTSFNVSLANRGAVNGLALQPDGRIVMVGDFERVNGVGKPTIARVNADGSIDSSFDGGTGFSSPPRDIESDSGGRLYAWGDFTSYNGSARAFFVRLLPGGALDTSFNATVDNTVYTIAFQADGKILIGGLFSSVNGSTAQRLARLNADGSLDATFAPVFGSVGAVESIAAQPDGKIMVGGSFLGVGGFNRQNLVRLNSDGSLDNTFNAGTISSVRQITPVSGGKYLALTNVIRKLNPDGTIDASYVSPSFGNNGLSSIRLRFLVLPDESAIVVGEFNLISGITGERRGITALFPNGRLAEQTYPKGANSFTYDIVRQTDGKIIVGGAFDFIEEVPRAAVARLNAPVLTKRTLFDYDGDGKSDVSVFRPSENKWYILRSSDFAVVQQVFAIAGDKPVPADYDGDGKTDLAVFRPSNGDWWYLSSVSGVQANIHWGQSGDIPLPADYDGDRKADFIVYRPSQGIWYHTNGSAIVAKTFGAPGDIPLIGDVDGDGRSEPLIFRPSTGDWWWQSNIDNIQRAVHWGQTGDVPVPADYDADGKTDFAVYRPSEGGWYVAHSSNNNVVTLSFGTAGDKPVAADYDGDGKADIAVFRPSTGIWYLLQTNAGFGALQWGVAADVPTQNAFLP